MILDLHLQRSSYIPICHMETTKTLDGSEMKFMPTEWTNEKHSLYLKDIESTFINQLNASTNFFSLHSQKEKLLNPKLPRQTQYNAFSTTSDQFKVCQGGRWKKVCYGRPDPQLNKDDSRRLLANPWNQRFGRKRQALADPALRETALSMNREKVFSCELVTPRPHWSDQDLEGSDNEASDQNFIGEAIEGEKASSICSPNRLKRLMSSDNSNNEQACSSS